MILFFGDLGDCYKSKISGNIICFFHNHGYFGGFWGNCLGWITLAMIYEIQIGEYIINWGCLGKYNELVK